MSQVAEDDRVDQYNAALRKANQVRAKRTQIKRDLTAGTTTIREVLTAHHPELRTMPIGELLKAQYGWGRKRVTRFLNQIPLAEFKTIGSMTDRQICVLAIAIEGDTNE